MELAAVPYIPVPALVAEHAGNLREAGVEVLLLRGVNGVWLPVLLRNMAGDELGLAGPWAVIHPPTWTWPRAGSSARAGEPPWPKDEPAFQVRFLYSYFALYPGHEDDLDGWLGPALRDGEIDLKLRPKPLAKGPGCPAHIVSHPRIPEPPRRGRGASRGLPRVPHLHLGRRESRSR